MRVFAIGDVHLSQQTQNKSMDKFGPSWENHVQKLCDAWQAEIASDDLVLIPGDISWAMSLGAAMADLELLASLNGQKVLLRGNHDYWWSSYQKVLDSLPSGMYAIQNNALRFANIAIGGTRGWLLPESSGYSEKKDAKIYARELDRLGLTLSALPRDTENIIMLHYPPFSDKGQPSQFVDLLEQAPVSHVVYGHLHGRGHSGAFEGVRNGITYHFVSSDYLSFIPKRIL
ncbi:MAG: metallophosphoesterase [Clostridia bacterium]|nr:metallophosphoesterase [Clostridia bacterium]